jgi:hypothetical protein
MENLRTRKQKYTFLSEVFSKIQIDKSERDLYILSLELLSDASFEDFYNKIHSQIFTDGTLDPELHKKSIEPLSSNII